MGAFTFVWHELVHATIILPHMSFFNQHCFGVFVETKTAVVGMCIPAAAALIFLIWLLKWFCYSQGISSSLLNRQVISFC